MKLVRFLKKSYWGARIVEIGEEVLMRDDEPLAPHMLDLTAANAVPAPEPPAASVPEPVPPVEVHTE